MDKDITFIEENLWLEDEDLEHSYDIQDIQDEDLNYIENLSHEKIPHQEPILKTTANIDLDELFYTNTELFNCKNRDPTPGKQNRQMISYPIDYYIRNGAFTE